MPFSHDVREPIPVAIFTGYLGAGKTTVIQRITPQIIGRGERVLTVANDLSPDNTDVFAFQRGTGVADDEGHGVVALSGGCVCCNLLGALVEELLKAHAEGSCSYVILECTGVADPTPVVATIGALPALAGKFVVDALVTVISAASLAVVTAADSEKPSDRDATVTLDLARSDGMGGHQALGSNLVLINNWESLVARGTVAAETLAQWPVLLQDFCAEANPATRVQLTDRGAIDFVGTVWRRNLFTADGTLPYHLRAYAAAGKTLGNFGANEGQEEALELERLGLRLFTMRLVDTILSTRKLRAAMCGPKAPGKRLLKNVWRSKGFFTAVDDETATASGEEVAKQFRWQSVKRRFDYGEVLPPTVPLYDNAKPDVPLTCRIVFMGGFDDEAKATEAGAFFASLAVDAT